MPTAGDDLVCTTCGATALGGPDLPAGASAEDRLAVARLTWTRGTEHGEDACQLRKKRVGRRRRHPKNAALRVGVARALDGQD